MENNVLVLGPIFLPFLGAIIALIFAQNNRLQRIIGLVASIAAWLTACAVLYQNWDLARSGQTAVQIYRLGNWTPPYGIVLVADMLSALFVVMCTTVLVGGFLYTLQCKDRCITYPVFLPAFGMMSAAISGAFYTGDIFTLFVFLELMVISSVVMVAIADKDLALEAAIKYLLISAMGSLFLLIGIGAVYASLGTLTMADIGQLLETGDRPLLARAAAVMLTATFLLKSAVFPFHFWQPDFHTTAPTPISAMLSSIVVKVGVYGVIRLVTLLYRAESGNIGNILIILGIIGIFFGGLAALRTYDAKRVLAYSTFGQVGFIMVGIGWNTPLAMMGALVYAVNHAFIKSALLMLSGVVASFNQYKSAKLKDLVGAGKQKIGIGLAYFLGGLALAGVPPLNGFISKLALVRGGVQAQAWISLGLIVGGGLITLLYMTRVYVLIFQQKPTEDTAPQKEYGDSYLAPALLIAICVLLGLFSAPLVELARLTVEQLGDPTQYIHSVLGV
ncbi:MAG: hypothetical protein CUN56_07160 [Phototrophicales bacterium]|nr:MAG: hypothetical protein CUN56_07160 [Phototrophicales bacterium]RMG77188.1 MAG: hypothetical protein D6711_02145 [Chloroflexota bacterium]